MDKVRFAREERGPDALRLRRIAVGVGFLMAVLLALAPAGIFWTGVSVAQSPGAQAYEASYDGEFQRGLDFLRRRRYEDALKSFKRANEMHNKQSAECYFGMAQAYMALEAYKSAAESCDKMIEFSGADRQQQAQAYNLKGIAVLTQAASKDQKKLLEAETLFRQGLAQNTDLPILRYNLGYTLLQESRDPEGIAELKKYVELAPKGTKSEEALKLIENPRRAREAYAPDFSLTTSEGEEISLDGLRGKVVLLDFWGTWCPPCVESVPELRDLRKKYAKEPSFVMISISNDGVEQKWRDFIVKNQMVWPQFLDRDRKMLRAFEVHEYPTYIVIDPEGIVRYRSYGHSSAKMSSLDDAVRKQLKSIAKTPPPE